MPDVQSTQNHQDELRLAALDVGTNSIRLVIVDAYEDRSFRLLDDEKIQSQLGKHIAADGTLGSESIQNTVEAIRHLKAISDGYNVAQLRAVATCAVRDAPNKDVLLQAVLNEADLELEVISAEQEGLLAFEAARHELDFDSIAAAVVDIGGGSTEVVMVENGHVQSVQSIALGAVRATHNSRRTSASTTVDMEMLKWIDRRVNEQLATPTQEPKFIVGTGGTFTALASMSHAHQHSGDCGGAKVIRGYTMTHADIKRWLDLLLAVPDAERSQIQGLARDRAGIILAGTGIVDAVMRRLGTSTIRIIDRGIRDGLILGMIADWFPRLSEPNTISSDRWVRVRQFAQRCKYEPLHANHVAELSLKLFDQLTTQQPALLKQWDALRARDILKAAAILHDVGYFVNYSAHHKHSYHLILNSDLDGFSAGERRLIANVARYHRRALPKKKHHSFTSLTASEQILVQLLAGILRIGVGLDRAHSQKVEDIQVVLNEQKLNITLCCENEPEVELWGARRRCDLLADVLKLNIFFHWNSMQNSRKTHTDEVPPHTDPSR